jgi:DNA-binding transcriptional LysR family regulator
MRRADLADPAAFVAVADNLSFRAAASRLGVTPSALSHTMRHFEERIGVRLLNRTTRSVSLTDAGLRLLDRLRPAVEQISQALDDLKSEQGHPFWRLRLYVSHFAGVAVISPIWARFLSTFPTSSSRSTPTRRWSISWRRGSMPVSAQNSRRPQI